MSHTPLWSLALCCFLLVACGPGGSNPSDTAPNLDTGMAEDGSFDADPTGDTTSADAGGCQPGGTDERACGPNGDGVETRTCSADGVWEAWGPCTGSSACGQGEKSTRSCPGGGEQNRTCVDGEWSDWSECTSAWASISSTGLESYCLIDNAGAASCARGRGKPKRHAGPFQQALFVQGVFCGLRPDGTVMCEPHNWLAEESHVVKNVPSGKFEKLALYVYSSNYDVACGLRPSGRIDCWGDPEFVPDIKVGDETYVDLDHGHQGMCAVRQSGDLHCWGWREDVQKSPVSGSNYEEVTVGKGHVCGLKADGRVECGQILERKPKRQNLWEDDFDEFGQHEAPQGKFEVIDAGERHNCGVRTDGTVSCWGRNYNYESNQPEGTYVDVAVFGRHTSCALRQDGTLNCWGLDQPMCRLQEIPLTDGANACGSCENLPAQPGSSCTCSGTFRCTPDRRVSGTCDDGDNVADSATPQPKTDDGTDEWTTINDTLAAYDDDWYSVEVTDGTFGQLEPQFLLSSDRYNKLQVCAFYERDSGKTQGLGCERGVAAPWSHCREVEFQGGTRQAACQELVLRPYDGESTFEAPVSLNVPDTDDDSGTAYMRVTSFGREPGCIPYELSYRF